MRPTKRGMIHVDFDHLRRCLGLPDDVEVVGILDDRERGIARLLLAGENEGLPMWNPGETVQWIGPELLVETDRNRAANVYQGMICDCGCGWCAWYLDENGVIYRAACFYCNAELGLPGDSIKAADVTVLCPRCSRPMDFDSAQRPIDATDYCVRQVIRCAQCDAFPVNRSKLNARAK